MSDREIYSERYGSMPWIPGVDGSNMRTLDAYLQRQYSLTLPAYADLFDRQGRRCAICEDEPKRQRLVVDHDHKTGEIRGLLCDRCNRFLLKYSKEDPAILRRAAGYLDDPPTRSFQFDAELLTVTTRQGQRFQRFTDAEVDGFRALVAAGMAQTDLAERLGISTAYLSRLLRGERGQRAEGKTNTRVLKPRGRVHDKAKRAARYAEQRQAASRSQADWLEQCGEADEARARFKRGEPINKLAAHYRVSRSAMQLVVDPNGESTPGERMTYRYDDHGLVESKVLPPAIRGT